MRLRLAFVVLLIGFVVVPTAAAEPCWQLVISDSYDGRIDRVYAPQCYRAAIARLPADAETVSAVPNDLRRGLQRSLAAPPAERRAGEGGSSTPGLIVIAVGGAFLLVSSGRMLRARRRGR